MSWYHQFSNLFRRGVLDREIDDELTTHIAERADELVEQGMSEKDALDCARRQFGNYTRRKEDTKAIHLLHWLETVLQDMRYAFRTLRSNPAFAATAVLSLALGIGANTAIFSIINAVMLRSLPVEDPSKLVQIGSKEIGNELTNPIWEYLRDHQQALSGVLAYSPDRFDLSDGGESRFTRGIWVSGDFFQCAWRASFAGTSLHQTGGAPRRSARRRRQLRILEEKFPKRYGRYRQNDPPQSP